MVKKDGVSIVEVIVVDDASQVSIELVVARFYDQLDLTLITQTNAGLAQARNKAQQGQG